MQNSQRRSQAAGQSCGSADLPKVEEKQAKLLVNHVIVDAEDTKLALGYGTDRNSLALSGTHSSASEQRQGTSPRVIILLRNHSIG